MMNPILRIAAVAAVLLAAGCGGRSDNASQPQTGGGQQAGANLQLVTDIPIPPNATLDNDRSLILTDRDHWTGRMVMRFWQNTAELAAFYQAQMPSFGWEPVMAVTSGTSVLNYIRADRAASVQIEKSMMGMTSTVSVVVAPRQVGGGAVQPSSGYDSRQPPPPAAYDTPSRQPVRSESLPPR